MLLLKQRKNTQYRIFQSILDSYYISLNRKYLSLCYFVHLPGDSLNCYFDGSTLTKSGIKCGIPQGSCLGPLLFILYINDFENFLESTIPNMYADDTCVNIASENLNELLTDLKNELENISNWMRINLV